MDPVFRHDTSENSGWIIATCFLHASFRNISTYPQKVGAENILCSSSATRARVSVVQGALVNKGSLSKTWHGSLQSQDDVDKLSPKDLIWVSQFTVHLS